MTSAPSKLFFELAATILSLHRHHDAMLQTAYDDARRTLEQRRLLIDSRLETYDGDTASEERRRVADELGELRSVRRAMLEHGRMVDHDVVDRMLGQ